MRDESEDGSGPAASKSLFLTSHTHVANRSIHIFEGMAGRHTTLNIEQDS